MLSADADFEIGPGFAAAFRGHPDQLADSFAVEHRKWVLFEDTFLQVRGQHLVDVIAGKTESGLREIVGAEEKNWASFAISSATNAARGNSIIVPTR